MNLVELTETEVLYTIMLTKHFITKNELMGQYYLITTPWVFVSKLQPQYTYEELVMR